jgi:hypothetical protein
MRNAVLSLCCVLALSACGGGSQEAAPSPTLEPAPTPTPTLEPCPAPGATALVWPKDVPSDLPKPPGAGVGDTSKSLDGLTLVKFTTQTSLQDSVLFVVRNVSKAGFTLGRGDAEPAEADAPFGRGDLRGIYKMLARDRCVTDWLVAVTRTRPGGGSPVLPTASRGPSSQPLPFG